MTFTRIPSISRPIEGIAPSRVKNSLTSNPATTKVLTLDIIRGVSLRKSPEGDERISRTNATSFFRIVGINRRDTKVADVKVR